MMAATPSTQPEGWKERQAKTMPRSGAHRVGISLVCAFLYSTALFAQGERARSAWEIAVGAARWVDFDPQVERAHAHANRRLGTWIEPVVVGRVRRALPHGLGLESEGRFYPRYFNRQNPGPQYRGFGKLALVAGATLSLCNTRCGVFAVAHAGVMRIGRVPAILVVDSQGRTRVEADNYPGVGSTIDLGLGIKHQLSARLGIRVDVSDVMIWNSPGDAAINPRFVRHNVQLVAGISKHF
jgi:hypothetical protein